MNLQGKRIAVGGFLHETNTFQQQKTAYADFAEAGDRAPLTRGADVLERFTGLNTSIAGWVSANPTISVAVIAPMSASNRKGGLPQRRSTCATIVGARPRSLRRSIGSIATTKPQALVTCTL